MKKIDLYDYPRKYELSLIKLEKDRELSKQDKKDIVAFSKTKLAKGCSHGRVSKVVYCLRFLGRWLRKPYRKATKKNLISLIGTLEANPKYSEHTKYDFKIVLKMFYKWLKGNDEEYPPEVKWLTPKLKNDNHKLPEELLTEEEVLKMVDSSNNPRDKAFILVLYESGCRIGELLTLQLKNISFDQYGAILRVTGKTGDRRVRIVGSTSVLASWIDLHPSSKDPEAPVWPQSATNHHDSKKCLKYPSVLHLIRKAAEKANIKKRVYPHLFRHSRATSLANKLTEAQMKEYFGWTRDSDMASTYVHLSGRDVDSALLQMYSFKEKPVENDPKLDIKTCLRCKEKNSPNQSFCGKCGNPLDEKVILTDPNKKPNELMNSLMEDNEFKEFIMKKISEKGLDKTILGE